MTDETQTVEVDKAQVETEIKKIGEELRAYVEKSGKEVEESGKVATETKNAVQALSEKWHETDQRLLAIEQMGGGSEAKTRKTAGAEFAGSEEFKAMQEGRASRARFETKTALINATQNSSQPLVPADHLGQIAALPFRSFDVWNAIPKGSTASNVVTWPRATRTNNAGPQVGGSPEAFENVTKPESAYSFTLIERPVRTIAHFLPVSTQVMEDSPFLESFLNVDMVDGLREEVEDQCLSGSGANGNLSGLLTEATAYAEESPIVAASKTGELEIRSAIRQLQEANYMASHIVLSPRQWFSLESSRINAGTDDRYIWANPQDASDKRLWGVPVIVTNAMNDTQFLVGDMSQCMAFEKSGISFQAAYQDSTNFQKNMVTLRAECRLSLVVKRTEAFVVGTFS